MKIYLAGKISPDDYRHGIVPGLRDAYFASDIGDPWPELQGAVFGHDYVGPFFISCDHGCAHGPNSHGMDAGRANHDTGEVVCRFEVVRRCLAAIDKADLVFAWMAGRDAHGTLVELGYAVARGKIVIVAAPPCSDPECPNGALRCQNNTPWFATYLPEVPTYRTVSPAQTLHDWLDCYARARARERCESPIEMQMFDAMSAINLDFVLQHEVDRYRLDFAFVNERVAVECDGHDFHERTKEQAAHDRRRDRAMTAAGWKTLRFTGSEIHRDAAACANEVKRIIQATGTDDRS